MTTVPLSSDPGETPPVAQATANGATASTASIARKYESDGLIPATWQPYVPFAIAIALFFGVYARTFWWMIGRWQSDPSATHGWLVIPIAAGVIWYQRDRLKGIPLSSHTGGLWVMALALIMHLTEVVLDMNGPSPLSIPLFLSGAVWYFMGTRWLKELAFPLAYLLFMVPIPGFLNQFASFPLRRVATDGSKIILGWMGVEIYGAGMNMEFWRPGSDHTNPDRDFIKLLVADPCSGLHSLMAIKALHAITAYLSRLTVGWKWVLFWCALPISMAANVLRMVSIVLVSAYVDKEFGLKAWHDYSPYLLFLFVFGILFFVGIVMEFATGAHRRDINAKNKEADFTEFTKGNHAE